MQKSILLLILVILGFSISSNAQGEKSDYVKILEHFKKYNWRDSTITSNNLYPYSEEFNISITNNLIELDTIHIVIKHPYFSEKFDNAYEEKDYVKNFPKSFSVIYDNSLVSLFENGKFVCYKLDDFERNINLEDKLNSKKFKHHWIINNKLGALSGNSIYIWNDEKWIKYKDNFPLEDQPKLFEDDEFIIYKDCHGEWGGTIYFFEKSTSKTFFTESTCANSVIKQNNEYNILANLGHGGGSAEIKVITDPRKLTLAKPNEINKWVNGEALGYTDKSNAFEKKLDFYGIQIFSSFIYNGKELYIVHLSDLTFIAEIKNNETEIVNPLFFNDLYTHDPITTQYRNYILINLDHYGTGLYREISVMIINGNRITKLDWNENHNR